MISIIIPTYNNKDYLKLCINSLKKNSYYDNEILVHVNEGNDGTVEYLKEKKINFTFSKTNIGLCSGCNLILFLKILILITFYILMMTCIFYQIGILY